MKNKILNKIIKTNVFYENTINGILANKLISYIVIIFSIILFIINILMIVNIFNKYYQYIIIYFIVFMFINIICYILFMCGIAILEYTKNIEKEQNKKN